MPFDPHVYRLASIARNKLCREAARDSHDLRVLVAHANILDELLIELNAPRGTPTEHNGFDLLPKSAAGRAERAERAVRRKVVVTVSEANEHKLEDEAHHEAAAYLNSEPSPSSLPILYHDSDSESDSGSDSDIGSDDDDFETAITPSSPTNSSNTSMSSVDEETEPDEGELALVRTKSPIWRFFGSTTASSEDQEKRKDLKLIDDVANEVHRLTVSTT